MTTKAQKDTKPFAPRLLPRQTAASAARAARNATNRNLTQPAAQRQSPPRVPPTPAKGKTPAPRPQKAEYKADEIKTIGQSDPETCNNGNKSPPAEHNPYIIEVSSSLTIDEMPDESLLYGCGRTITEISESDFENEMKQNDEFPTEFQAESYLQQTLRTEDKSRPQTPATVSRPQTPKSVQSSRPQTPGLPSRPTTPAHPTQRHGTPTSRPNTPQRPPSRSRTPASIHTQPTARVLSPSSMSSQPRAFNEDDDIKSTYIMKQRQFQRMKKELDLKQQAILEIFDNLRGLRERMTREGISGGGEGISQQELVVFNVADWTAEEVSQLCREAVNTNTVDGAADLINTTVAIDECALAELDNKVLNVPSHFADLCLQAFTARQEIIDWVKELIEKKENGDGEMLERIARYNTQGLELCDTLRELKSRADDAVDTVTQLSKRACRERGALVAVGESLVREVARLRQDLESRSAVINEIKEMQADAENNKLEEIRRELEEERSSRNVIKDKLATTESQLRQARNRVAKMDRQLRESEASIASLTGTVKTLEDQSRQKEVQLEARARKLKESLKTGEVASNHLAQQRDALQAEVQELKQQIESLQTQHKATVLDLNGQLKEMKNNVEEQRQIIAKEVELKEAAEGELRETQICVEELKAKITELENMRPNPDLPSEREMDLWAELQATKDTLRITEEEVVTCKREKVRFLESLTKITESDNKVALQQKLTAELLSKEEIMGKMQIQIRELTKNLKLNEQKVIQYAQYVSDLQAHNRAVANCQEAPNGISYQDLQQEIMNLRMGLLEAVHRNEELAEVLVQKEQQLEQQDKTSRAQARVIKLQVAQVREELINMLKNKETEQSRELAALQQDLEHRMKIVDEVNKQIAAKADEIQELFVTLENKQQQTHRLEKIVLALEEQQRRAQAQRTRHEEKIASLEHELASSGSRRERKFLFF